MIYFKKCIFLLLFLLLPGWLYAAEDGARLYIQCAGCHGKDGKTRAFGRSDIIAGQSAQDLYDTLVFFKESEFTQHGVAKVMAKQVKKISLRDLKVLSEYISTLK